MGRLNDLLPLTMRNRVNSTPVEHKPASIEQLFSQAIACHQAAQWDDAISLYQQIIDDKDDYVPAHINLGAAYRQKQEYEKAKQCYKQSLKYDPQSIEAWFNLGHLWTLEKKWDKAEYCFNCVLQESSDHAETLYQLSVVARLQGDWHEVITRLLHFLTLYPEAMVAHLEVGNAYRHQGQNALALTHYQQAVTCSPKSWKTHYSLARLADQIGDKALFKTHYAFALEYVDDPFYVHIALGQTRLDNGFVSGAEEQYEQALLLNADSFDARLGLASALMIQGKVALAQQHFQRLSQFEDVSSLSALAKVLWDYRFHVESIQVLERIVQLRPDLADTHLNLAVAYAESWQLSKALVKIKATLAINPVCHEAEDLQATVFLRLGHCDKSIAIHEGKLQREPTKANAASLLFQLLYSASYSVKEKAQRHRALMQTLMPVQEAIVFKQAKQQDKVLKIAYISADFRDQHPVGLFVTPVLKHHNPRQFEITVYYNHPTYDASTKSIRELTHKWHDVASWTDARLQQQILADEIDILVDLSGQTAKNRLGVFALRAAPIQVSWLGYPHSSGLHAMDYLIADSISCPVENDGLCSEEVYRLPDHCVFCYPHKTQYAAYTLPRDASDTVVFGSFNNLTKINEQSIVLWVRLLKAIPHAHLYLKAPSFSDADCVALFYNHFTQQGIDNTRLRFEPPSGLDEMMLDYLKVDIGLDPIPYNGGTTSLQALWMGVPIVTLMGDHFCGRMGASIMYHAGLADWVAEDEDGYIAVAQQKSIDLDRLRRLKHQLREQLIQSPLFDNKGFTVALETAYQHFWKRYCQQ